MATLSQTKAALRRVLDKANGDVIQVTTAWTQVQEEFSVEQASSMSDEGIDNKTESATTDSSDDNGTTSCSEDDANWVEHTKKQVKAASKTSKAKSKKAKAEPSPQVTPNKRAQVINNPDHKNLGSLSASVSSPVSSSKKRKAEVLPSPSRASRGSGSKKMRSMSSK